MLAFSDHYWLDGALEYCMDAEPANVLWVHLAKNKDLNKYDDDIVELPVGL